MRAWLGVYGCVLGAVLAGCGGGETDDSSTAASADETAAVDDAAAVADEGDADAMDADDSADPTDDDMSPDDSESPTDDSLDSDDELAADAAAMSDDVLPVEQSDDDPIIDNPPDPDATLPPPDSTVPPGDDAPPYYEPQPVVTQQSFDEDASLLGELVPFQEWPALGGEAVGVLFVPYDEQYGAVYSHGRGLTNPDVEIVNTYRFGVDGSSPFVLYFEAQSGEGYNFLSDWRVPDSNGDDVMFDAAQFGPEDLQRWGVSQPVHLMRLEINSQLGGPGGIGALHFVATDGEVLDGSDDYPLDPVELFRSSRGVADQTFGSTAFQELYEQAKADATPDDMGASLQEVDQIGLLPTWMTDSDTLRLAFVHRAWGQWSSIMMVQNQCPECPPGAPCVQCDPITSAQVNYLFGVEEAIVFEFDTTGDLVTELLHPPQAVPLR